MINYLVSWNATEHTDMNTFRSIIIFLFASFLTSCGQTPTKKPVKKIIVKNYFDSREQLMIKLYKTTDKSLSYWETWNTNDKNAIIHWGLLGDLGEFRYMNATTHNELKDSLNSQITEKINGGYAEISLNKQFTLAITFKLKTWGTPEDLTKREEYRNIITYNLGWTGNGRCDDGDIGSGEMTLYADVVDPYLAIKTLQKEFEEKKILEDYYFTISKGDKILAEKILSKPR